MSLISGYLTIKAILYFKLLDVARVVLNSLNVNIHDSRTDGPIWSDSAVLSAQFSDSVSAVVVWWTTGQGQPANRPTGNWQLASGKA